MDLVESSDLILYAGQYYERFATKYRQYLEATPNHSLNRTHCGVPAFGPPFHSGPNAVTPQCTG